MGQPRGTKNQFQCPRCSRQQIVWTYNDVPLKYPPTCGCHPGKRQTVMLKVET